MTANIIEALSYFAIIGSLFGMWANAHGRMTESYWIWLPANLLWVIYHCYHEAWSAALLFAIFTLITIRGLSEYA